jgi:hypothetical protein
MGQAPDAIRSDDRAIAIRPRLGSGSRAIRLREAVTLITSLADWGVMNDLSASCAFNARARIENGKRENPHRADIEHVRFQ